MKNHTFLFYCSVLTMSVIMVFYIQVSVAQKVVNRSSQNIQDSLSKKEVKPASNGKLVMRVALTGTTDNTTIKGTTTNMLVYNTAKAGVSPYNVYPGYYHNVGTTLKPDWKRVEVSVSNAVKNKN